MPEIDQHTEILEDYEPLLELRATYETRNRAAYEGLRELTREFVLGGRVAPGDCSPGAPTDPDVRDYRIRFLR